MRKKRAAASIRHTVKRIASVEYGISRHVLRHGKAAAGR